MKANFIKTRNVKSPSYGTPGSNGLDLYIPLGVIPDHCPLEAGETRKIPSGIRFELPEEHALVMMPRSSAGLRGIIAACPLIDSDYTGEVHITLTNVSDHYVLLKPGDRLVQLCLVHMPQLELTEIHEDEIKESVRGSQGFGSTGNS